MRGGTEGDDMKKVILKCPKCREKFKYDVADGWPDNCQVCGEDINNRVPDNVVTVPAFLSQKSKNNDKVARDIMDGSEVRAELAAATAGVPVSEMSGLKITDLNDRNDAQFAAKEVRNEVTQRMDAMQAAGLPTGFGTNTSDAMARAAASHTGDAPYAGLRAMKNLQQKLAPVGQAPLPLQITHNPNYRSPV
jgi:hypothetical protein